jgi:hypothetical protein
MPLLSPPLSRKERAATEMIFSWFCALCSREYRMPVRVRSYSNICQLLPSPAHFGRLRQHAPEGDCGEDNSVCITRLVIRTSNRYCFHISYLQKCLGDSLLLFLPCFAAAWSYFASHQAPRAINISSSVLRHPFALLAAPLTKMGWGHWKFSFPPIG